MLRDVKGLGLRDVRALDRPMGTPDEIEIGIGQMGGERTVALVASRRDGADLPGWARVALWLAGEQGGAHEAIVGAPVISSRTRRAAAEEVGEGPILYLASVPQLAAAGEDVLELEPAAGCAPLCTSLLDRIARIAEGAVAMTSAGAVRQAASGFLVYVHGERAVSISLDGEGVAVDFLVPDRRQLHVTDASFPRWSPQIHEDIVALARDPRITEGEAAARSRAAENAALDTGARVLSRWIPWHPGGVDPLDWAGIDRGGRPVLGIVRARVGLSDVPRVFAGLRLLEMERERWVPGSVGTPRLELTCEQIDGDAERLIEAIVGRVAERPIESRRSAPVYTGTSSAVVVEGTAPSEVTTASREEPSERRGRRRGRRRRVRPRTDERARGETTLQDDLLGADEEIAEVAEDVRERAHAEPDRSFEPSNGAVYGEYGTYGADEGAEEAAAPRDPDRDAERVDRREGRAGRSRGRDRGRDRNRRRPDGESRDAGEAVYGAGEYGEPEPGTPSVDRAAESAGAEAEGSVEETGGDREIAMGPELGAEAVPEAEPARRRRSRAAIVVRNAPDSILAALVLARDRRNIVSFRVIAQDALMDFFRGPATDIPDNTDLLLVGFSAQPTPREIIDAAELFRGRLEWYDHHEWPVEDAERLRQAIGRDAFLLVEDGSSALPAIVASTERRSRLTDKIVDLAGRRLSEPDMRKFGYRLMGLVKRLAASPGEHRNHINPVLSAKPADLPDAGAVFAAEDEWLEQNDPRVVHFGEYQMAVVSVPSELDAGEIGRKLRLRTGVRLSLTMREGDEVVLLGCNEEKRSIHVVGLAEQVAQALPWVRAMSGGDRLGRLRIEGLGDHPERLDAVISEIAKHRSVLYG